MSDLVDLEEFDNQLSKKVSFFLKDIDPFLEMHPEFTYLAVLDRVFGSMMDYCYQEDSPLEAIEALNSCKRIFDEDFYARYSASKSNWNVNLTVEEEDDD